MNARPSLTRSHHFWPLLGLFFLCTLYWSSVLFTDQVLLPGDFLRGFAPFGSDPKAPWNLLQWDALGQYYPWRVFAARQLQEGLIPLWNPHQFAGAPFVANLQSAVFYPLNLPFWLFDVARAFGISAWLHSLLACFGTYALAQRWKLSRLSSVLAAIAFAFGGYLTSWIVLPTLADTASWLPLIVLLFERVIEERKRRDIAVFVIAFTCAMLAGHVQVFFYIGCALFLQACLFPRFDIALQKLAALALPTVALGAIQLLPTMELARLGHRASQGGPSADGWGFVKGNALPFSDLGSLFLPGPPLLSFSENFGYVGILTMLLAAGAIVGAAVQRKLEGPALFALVLALFGLLYALATPLAQLFYYMVPGLSQMGGTGRAFVLWNLGLALAAGFGLDFIRRKTAGKASSPSSLAAVGLPCLALLLVTAELFAASWNLQPRAPRATIYPETELTTYLKTTVKTDERILFVTPRNKWAASEDYAAAGSERQHPAGVLPPNGAMVYGLNDVSGYDSLTPLAYRQFVADGEKSDPSPMRNGNMLLLNNPRSQALDQLNVRYVVSAEPLSDAGTLLKTFENSYVYQRPLIDMPRLDGTYFSPGFTNEKYQPGTFRFGAFLSLCTLSFLAALFFRKDAP